MGDHDDYDYATGKSDVHDVIEFGKYSGWTPRDVARKDPGYLRWAYHNIPRWVGSDKFIQKVCEDNGWQFRKTELVIQEPSWTPEDTSGFETAVLAAYGVYPLKAKHTWSENHNEY